MAPPRILVADDDAWILRMVTTVLEKRGYVVETAVDGEEAYEKAVASPPDLLITDVMMPKMDGWMLVKALRSRPEFSFVPVIFLTALGTDDDRIRGFRLGADDYMPKPFRFEELDLRVAKTLKHRQALEQNTREAISSEHQAVQDPGDMTAGAGISGKLEQVGLPSLLTLMEMEKKSGIMVVRNGDTTARLYMRDGRVIAARVDGADTPANQECVFLVLSWNKGAFEFIPSDIEMVDEVKASTTHLLMEAARLQDEQNAP